MNTTSKTNWHYAEGQDEAGNPVIQKEVPTEVLTSEAVFGTPWKSIAWMSAFSVAAVAMAWQVKKAGDFTLTRIITIAFLGVIIGVTGMQVRDVVMKKV